VFTEYASEDDCLLTNNFEEVWHKSRHLNAIRNPESYIKECKSCNHLEVCSGGCHARAFINKGSFFSKDPLCPF
jgi:radical SAM protein with 4Fe4S-binding SPASM domain